MHWRSFISACFRLSRACCSPRSLHSRFASLSRECVAPAGSAKMASNARSFWPRRSTISPPARRSSKTPNRVSCALVMRSDLGALPSDKTIPAGYSALTRLEQVIRADARSFQPRQAQGVGPPRKVLRPINQYGPPGIGKAQARVQRVQALHGLPRLVRSPGKGGAGRGKAVNNLHLWPTANGCLRCGERLTVPPGDELGQGHRGLDADVLGIMRTEAFGTRKTFDGQVRVAHRRL